MEIENRLRSDTDTTFDGEFYAGSNCFFNRCRIGRFFGCGSNVRGTNLHIGSFCSIGDNVDLNAGQHRHFYLTTHLFKYLPHRWDEVTANSDAVFDGDKFDWRVRNYIGNDVLISSNVIVSTGVEIATGSVIGANSFLKRSTSPYEIVGGNPAKTLGFRFAQSTIDRLLLSRWWDLPIGFLVSLDFSNIDKSLSKIEQFRSY